MKTTERNLERLADHARNIVQDLEALLESIPEELGDEARKARRKLERRLESAKETCERLEDHARAKLHAVDDIIREKPYTFLGAAFALGVLLGLVSSRR